MLRNYFTLYHAAMELHQRLAGGQLLEIYSEHKNEVTLDFVTPALVVERFAMAAGSCFLFRCQRDV